MGVVGGARTGAGPGARGQGRGWREGRGGGAGREGRAGPGWVRRPPGGALPEGRRRGGKAAGGAPGVGRAPADARPRVPRAVRVLLALSWPRGAAGGRRTWAGVGLCFDGVCLGLGAGLLELVAKGSLILNGSFEIGAWECWAWSGALEFHFPLEIVSQLRKIRKVASALFHPDSISSF